VVLSKKNKSEIPQVWGEREFVLRREQTGYQFLIEGFIEGHAVLGLPVRLDDEVPALGLVQGRFVLPRGLLEGHGCRRTNSLYAIATKRTVPVPVGKISTTCNQ
jgi:hypothetical protein